MKKTTSLLVATNNPGKVIEFQEILVSYPEIGHVFSVNDVVVNPERLASVETGSSYLENAFLKAQFAHLAAKLPTIADDSGLEVEALGGRPGLYSERFAKPEPGEMKAAAGIRQLLAELKDVPRDRWTAHFVCTVVFLMEGITLSATGRLDGTIIETPRGPGGFGFDPIFLPSGADRTLAEMTAPEKNAISHRAKAIHNLMKELRAQNVALVIP